VPTHLSVSAFDSRVYDWEAMTVGDDHYLLAAVHSSAPSSTGMSTPAGSHAALASTVSVVYRWQGVEKFVPVHGIDCPAATDWETFTTTRGEVFLVCANGAAGVSQLFKVKMV